MAARRGPRCRGGRGGRRGRRGRPAQLRRRRHGRRAIAACFSDPSRAAEFEANVPVAFGLADAIGCTRLNALRRLCLARSRARERAPRGRRCGAGQDDPHRGRQHVSRTAPICFRNTRESAAFVRYRVPRNVRLQYDAYHMQRMEGNLLPTIAEHLDLIGHIQIADAPGRGEPGTGEIDYGTCCRRSTSSATTAGSAEYKPTRPPSRSLDWMVRCRVIGFIGLGVMGAPMARNLVRRGLRRGRRSTARRSRRGRALRVAARGRERRRRDHDAAGLARRCWRSPTTIVAGAARRCGSTCPRSTRRSPIELAAARRRDARRAGLRRRRRRPAGHALDHGRRRDEPTSSARGRSSRRMGRTIVHVGGAGAGQS